MVAFFSSQVNRWIIIALLWGVVFFSVKAYQRGRGIPLWQFNKERGRGIPSWQFGKEYCLNKPNGLGFNRLIDMFSDPRISQAQMKLIIDDCFADLDYCPFGDNETHKTYKHGNNVPLRSTIRGILICGGDKITEEMVETMLSAPQNINKWHFGRVANRESQPYNGEAPFTFNEPYIETLSLLFLSKKLSAKVYWENFNDMAKAFDASQFRDDILKAKKDGNKECELFEAILGSHLVTKEDITRLCYSKYAWLQEIALKHPLSIPTNGVIIALQNGNAPS